MLMNTITMGRQYFIINIAHWERWSFAGLFDKRFDCTHSTVTPRSLSRYENIISHVLQTPTLANEQ